MTESTTNLLYYGDNLDILRRYVKDETIDLVYLDPPFNSNTNYNVLFAEKDGSQAASQIQAFSDTWTWTQESESTFAEIVTAGGKVSDCLQAFRTFLGECDMLAYLVMMAPRLVEIWRTLKSTGSIYLHCDPTASHYLKMLMDAVFGGGNFRNEVIWHYGGWTHQKMKQFPRKHDNLLFYSRSNQVHFFPVSIPWTKEEYIALRKQAIKTDESGREYIYDQRGAEGGRRYLDVALKEGRPIDSVWDIRPLTSSAKERLGYPTQKPEALLERIIQASSNEGDVIMDPFCGCGTAVVVAHRLNRRWIEIDITHLAINLIKNRLKDSFGEAATYKVLGEPVSVPDAERLAESDPYQFQWWALGLVGARPVEQKKGADKGIDGRIVFQGDKPGTFESVILSVKAGKTGSPHVRDLKGVLDREKAAIGVLISMQEPSSPMKTEAVTAGFYECALWGQKYPKIQLLTVAELLAGKKVEMPPIRQVQATFKKAPKAIEKQGEQQELPV